ncbi:hypothetical protein GCM10011352_22480 [Marinobacterium zhoushanense]|uniref:DUF1285 domain-containing protein n=1 Tax=Marinobacterium zhoushanense TaxID=1679163 RepID=A0ABQ1KFK4_9GAMM|nr:DUF1285 domain-containing protein [Marinobacterium zhoushanense]GGB95885.1 hypothetical protein GCM10011352_22480 [Marinobacterium zhoushanense]
MSGVNLTDLSHGLEQQEQGIPPLERWNPDFCGDIDMRIARDGTWYHEGTPIGRKAMVKMFSRILWQENGSYFLKTPVEKVGIQVDDLPFLLIDLEVIKGEQGVELHFTSSTDDHIVAGPEHPLRMTENSETGEPEPALAVRFGMSGRINRNVFYQLVELAHTEPCADGGEELVVYSQGERYSLGRI